jgi:hypothetical protein
MIILGASDTLAGIASAASGLTCTIFGMELNTATSVESYSTLYQGQLPITATTLYTATPDGPTFIRSITIVNTDLVNSDTFQLFRGGTADSNAITPNFVLAAGGSAIYEDGLGWNIADIDVGTTLLNDIHTGYQDWNAISVPDAPGSGVLRLFATTTAGRKLPKWIGPSGVDTWFQPALFGNNVVLFTPTASTTVTGGFGVTWAKGGSAGTQDTVTPTTTSPTIINQMKRFRHRNAVTTTNQALGVIATAAAIPWVWRGNAAGLGGFFFFTRFVVELWQSNSDRLFVGLTPGTTEQVTTNTFQNNTIGLWHDDTMGANVLYFATKDTTTYNNSGAAIAGATLATGQGYDFYIYARPNDSTIYYRLDDINAGTTLIDSSVNANLPTATVFLGPQVEMSNGATDIVVNTVGMGVNRIYIESDH